MIIDSSALVAIIRGEPERDIFLDLILHDPRRLVSAASLLETSIVVDAAGNPAASHALDALMADLDLTVVPFDEQQAVLARQAFRDYGKGSGRRAKLNFGDCMAYAAAVSTREPLLFKGDDFSHTDVPSAVAGSTHD